MTADATDGEDAVCLTCGTRAARSRRNGYFPPGWAVRDPGGRWYCPEHKPPPVVETAPVVYRNREKKAEPTPTGYSTVGVPPATLLCCGRTKDGARAWYTDPALRPSWSVMARRHGDSWLLEAYALTPGGAFSAPGEPHATASLPGGAAPSGVVVHAALWPTASTVSGDPWDSFEIPPVSA